MRHLLIFLIVWGICSQSVGQIVSTMDGPWASGSTWVGGVAPTATDAVVINHVVTYTTGLTSGQSLIHNGDITINTAGDLTMVQDEFSSFIWDGTGGSFEVFGTLTVQGRLFNYGYLQFHSGSIVNIANDLRLFDNSETIIDVLLNIGDDIYLHGPNPTICGSLTTDGIYDGSATLNDSPNSQIQFLDDGMGNFATLDNICQGFTVDILTTPASMVIGTGGFGPLFENNGVTLTISGTPFDEDGGVATVTATIPGTSANDITINLAFSGTAGTGIDYTPSATSISIPSGSSSGNMTLTGLDDPGDDDDETVIVDVTTVINALETTPQQQTATITDDDPKVTLGISGSPLAEDGGIAIVTATLSTTADEDLTIDLAFSGTATSVSDYVRSADQIIITSGNLAGSINITGVDDSDDDENETVIVDISLVTNGTEDGTQQVIAVITDDDDPPLITLGLSGSPVAENGGMATVTASLASLSNNSITIDLGFSGTATNVTDYTRSGAQIIVAPGGNSGSITITGVDDMVDETNETIIVDITSVTNGTEDGIQQVTATLTDDDDPPTVTLGVSEATIPETGGSSTVTATLSALSEKDVTVDLGFSGTATFSADYAAENSIMISAGNLSNSFNLLAQSDLIDEEDETAIIDITGATNATEVGTQQEIVTITDDDDPPTVTLSVSEAAIPETGGSSTITATLIALSGQDVTVNLDYTGTAMTGVDYTAASSIIISAGNFSNAVSLDAQDDLIDEADETAIIDISSVVNGTENGTQQETVTITDDDTAPTVTLSTGASPIAENGGSSTVTATLIALSGLDVTVNLDYTGTATTGVDYTAASSIIISAGNLSNAISLDAQDDLIDEADETAIIDIASVVNATESGTQQETVTITDDDTPPTVTLSSSVSPIAENGGSSMVTATLIALSGQDVTVNLGYSGTATSGVDYTAASSIIVTAGNLSNFISLDSQDDLIDEADETAIIDITSVINGTESGTQQETVTITDDDPPPTVTLGLSGSPFAENGGIATVSATLSATSEIDVTIDLGYTGTATNTTDYVRSAEQIVNYSRKSVGQCDPNRDRRSGRR